jgi:2-hydroxycyclohexanecarboxyl-CoA dehydrogenase
MNEGRVALVTGAAGGLGAACSIRLAEEGIAIGVLDIDEQRCAGTVKAIEDAGGQAMVLGADVSDRAQVGAAVETLRSAFGPITIAVNNAGVVDFSPLEDVTDELFHFVYGVNVLGPFLVTQAVLPDMKAAGWGRIVNISSSSAQTGAPNMSVYASSKGAIISLTRSLAQELGPLGITVNTIPPGTISGTVMSGKRMSDERNTEFAKGLPVRRIGVPEDIANACAWLCSEASSYVTGQIIGVNGGRVVT